MELPIIDLNNIPVSQDAETSLARCAKALERLADAYELMNAYALVVSGGIQELTPHQFIQKAFMTQTVRAIGEAGKKLHERQAAEMRDHAKTDAASN